MRMRHGAVALCTVGLLAGCGSSGGSKNDDSKQIIAVLDKAVTTKDPQVKCVETVTTGFVSTIYGDLATCKKAETPQKDDTPPPTSVDVAAIKVSGDTATATVTEHGGADEGATGSISLAKEGGAWKVSELSVAFLRSQLETSLKHVTDKSNPLSKPGVADCVNTGMQALPDGQFKDIAYAAISDKDTDPRFLAIYTKCDPDAAAASSGSSSTDNSSSSSSGITAPSGSNLSAIRKGFEQGLIKSAQKSGATQKQVNCVLNALRKSVTDDDIAAAVKDPSKTAPITQKTAAALAACK